MPYIALTVSDLRQQPGETLDRILQGEAIELTRHGRPLAGLLPWRLAELVPPDEDPHACAFCSVRWVGPGAFCPACGHPTAPTRGKGRKTHASR